MSETSRIAALPSRALIAVAGEDWRGFLQGLLTQDVETLRPGEARFGALLTPQGRLLYDLFIVGREEGCWLDCQAEQRGALLQRLTIYRLRAKVTIAPDETPVLAAWGVRRRATAGSRDPRLAALGWRGYGAADALPNASEADYRAPSPGARRARAGRLGRGQRLPARGRLRPAAMASTSRRAASSARRPPRG